MRPRQIQAESDGPLLIEVRNAPATGERMQIGTIDVDLRRAPLLEFDPNVVVATNRQRIGDVAPLQPSDAQLAVTTADRIAAEIDELLSRRQWFSLTHSHR